MGLSTQPAVRRSSVLGSIAVFGMFCLTVLPVASVMAETPSSQPHAAAPQGPIELNNTLNSTAYAVRFSPDGKLLVCALGGGLSVWDVATWKPLGMLKGQGIASFLAFSADSKLLASSGGDIRVWDLQSLKQIQKIDYGYEKSRKVDGVVGFSADAKHLVTQTPNEMHLWDLKAGTCEGKLPYPDVAVTGADVSPDRKFLVVGGPPDVLMSMQANPAPVKLAAKPKHAIYNATFWRFSSDSARVYSSDQVNHELNAWSVPDGRYLGSMAFPGLFEFALSLDGRLMVWDTENGPHKPADVTVTELKEHRTVLHMTMKGELNSIAISPDGRYVATVDNSDGVARAWPVPLKK